MSRLTVFADDNPTTSTFDSDNRDAIAEKLKQVGVRFEAWQTKDDIQLGASQEEVLQVYRQEIDNLIKEEGYQAVDVVSLKSDNPNKVALRDKFLSEHTHSEDEVRFFVGGEGLFSLHIGSQVFEVLCTKGDLISVPDGTPHWFDMGPNPNFIAIRLFNNPEGWVANYTGSDIASNFSRLEN